jgi:hypothetical protein
LISVASTVKEIGPGGFSPRKMSGNNRAKKKKKFREYPNASIAVLSSNLWDRQWSYSRKSLGQGGPSRTAKIENYGPPSLIFKNSEITESGRRVGLQSLSEESDPVFLDTGTNS